jgi:hypothetical protein
LLLGLAQTEAQQQHAVDGEAPWQVQIYSEAAYTAESRSKSRSGSFGIVAVAR